MSTEQEELVRDAYGHLVGRTITKVRPMTSEELAAVDWSGRFGEMPVVIELDDGTAVIPSRDFEGNGPGALFIEEEGIEKWIEN
jgi:hypothetical protein